MFDTFLKIQVVHEYAWRCTIELKLTSDSLLAATLSLVNNIVQNLRNSGPPDLVRRRTVIEQTVKKR